MQSSSIIQKIMTTTNNESKDEPELTLLIQDSLAKLEQEDSFQNLLLIMCQQIASERENAQIHAASLIVKEQMLQHLTQNKLLSTLDEDFWLNAFNTKIAEQIELEKIRENKFLAANRNVISASNELVAQGNKMVADLSSNVFDSFKLNVNKQLAKKYILTVNETAKAASEIQAQIKKFAAAFNQVNIDLRSANDKKNISEIHQTYTNLYFLISDCLPGFKKISKERLDKLVASPSISKAKSIIKETMEFYLNGFDSISKDIEEILKKHYQGKYFNLIKKIHRVISEWKQSNGEDYFSNNNTNSAPKVSSEKFIRDLKTIVEYEVAQNFKHLTTSNIKYGNELRRVNFKIYKEQIAAISYLFDEQVVRVKKRPQEVQYGLMQSVALYSCLDNAVVVRCIQFAMEVVCKLLPEANTVSNQDNNPTTLSLKNETSENSFEDVLLEQKRYARAVEAQKREMAKHLEAEKHETIAAKENKANKKAAEEKEMQGYKDDLLMKIKNLDSTSRSLLLHIYEAENPAANHDQMVKLSKDLLASFQDSNPNYSIKIFKTVLYWHHPHAGTDQVNHKLLRDIQKLLRVFSLDELDNTPKNSSPRP